MRSVKKSDTPDGAEVKSWRGYVQYCCTACQFDTLDPNQFADHWAALHVPPEAHVDVPAFEPAPAPVGETFVQE